MSSGGSLPPRTRYPPRTVRVRTAFPLFLGVLCLGSVPGAAFAGPLAPLPGTAVGTPATPGGADTARPAISAAEQLSRGVVTVERDGRILGVGAVLGGDHGEGRILTALSSLGASDTADVRYADGSVVHAKVGHRDRAWDLALLIPLTGHWFDGLVASPANPSEATLQAPVALHPGRPAVVPAHVRGLIDARAKEGNATLSSVLDVELQGATPTLGAPLIDGTGGVVGVFVKACQPTLPMVPPAGSPRIGAPAQMAAPPAPPCSPMIVVAPVSAIVEFLSHTPPTAVPPTPWLGIVGVTDVESNTHGVRVMAVAPDSPAQKAGLKANEDKAQADMIVAVDGQPVDSPERLAEMIGRHSIGERVKLLLLQGGKFHEAQVVLRTAP